MQPTSFLFTTACIEGGTGLLLLFLPAVPLELLLGVSQAAVEATFISRLTGAALISLSVACWMGREPERSPAQRGLLTGIFIYDVAAAGLLVYSGLGLNLAGIALWPAVAVHTVLVGWCVACFCVKA